MIVFHGTSCHASTIILTTEPRCPLSTSLDFAIGRLFALRRSPPAIMHGDFSEAGRIIEFRIIGPGWKHHKAPNVLQDEQEIRIQRASSIRAIAEWVIQNGDYVRNALC